MFKIYTLGSFDIKYKDKSIIEESGYPYKTLKLFKYFLTHEGKRLLPENIIEDLWGDNDYNDPNGTLRTQISRVRKMMNLDKLDVEPFFEIKYVNGYYIFKLENNCMLDVEEFEAIINSKNKFQKHNIEFEEQLKQAISLYNGVYLQELENEDWIIPIRSRYDRLYLKALGNCFEMLMKKQMYHDIIAICEVAMEYKFYEEIIHIYFLEALMAIGQEQYATNHYKFYTTKFYNDLNVAPSTKSREIYKKLQIQKKEKPNQILDLNIIKNVFKEDKSEGALVCEFPYFKFLYNFEVRNKFRNKCKDIFLGIITIDNMGYKPLTKNEIKSEMDTLKSIIYNKLRKGDVLSEWNDSQLVVLLYYAEEENIPDIMERLEDKFNKQKKNEKITLNIKYKKI